MKKRVWFTALALSLLIFACGGGDGGGGGPAGPGSDPTGPGGSGISLSVHNEASWNEAVKGIKNGGNNKTYTINITGNVSMAGTPFYTNTFGSVTGITVTITGNNVITLAADSTGYLLWIGTDQTVVMKDLGLKGHAANTEPLVCVYDGAFFTMQGSASVSGNDNTAVFGGGVRVFGGTFTMQGSAKVSGNSASYGGGVYAAGTFTMKDNATVSGNTGSNGGGVFASETFIMRDNASVSGNTAVSTTMAYSTANASGGGVNFVTGTFTMQDNATVSGNTAAASAAAEALSRGGGVSVVNGIFTIKDNATVSGNTAVSTGVIADASGGGIYTAAATFIKNNGGTIYGNTGGDTGNEAKAAGTVQESAGHAVYVTALNSSKTPIIKRRESTAGPLVNLVYTYEYDDTITYSGGWE